MLNQIIANDETWPREYELDLKTHSNEWHRRGSPQRHKLQQNPSPTKVVIILAYDKQSILECHPVCEDRTVNAMHYTKFSGTTTLMSTNACALANL